MSALPARRPPEHETLVATWSATDLLRLLVKLAEGGYIPNRAALDNANGCPIVLTREEQGLLRALSKIRPCAVDPVQLVELEGDVSSRDESIENLERKQEDLTIELADARDERDEARKERDDAAEQRDAACRALAQVQRELDELTSDG